MQRDLCVCELMFVLAMSQSRVSHQLRLLRDADLVEDRRDGRWMIYTVPAAARRSFEPLLRLSAAPEMARSGLLLKDAERLDLCLRENVRKRRDAERGASAARAVKPAGRKKGISGTRLPSRKRGAA
jgi:DNA-binding transcriptional ArsR family regulator